MTTSPSTDHACEATRHAPHPSAGRGDREALLNLYGALDPAGRAELLRLALRMVRRPGRLARTFDLDAGKAS